MKLVVTIDLEDRHYQDPAGYLGCVLQDLADETYWHDATGGELFDLEGRRIGEWDLNASGKANV